MDANFKHGSVAPIWKDDPSSASESDSELGCSSGSIQLLHSGMSDLGNQCKKRTFRPTASASFEPNHLLQNEGDWRSFGSDMHSMQNEDLGSGAGRPPSTAMRSSGSGHCEPPQRVGGDIFEDIPDE